MATLPFVSRTLSKAVPFVRSDEGNRSRTGDASALEARGLSDGPFDIVLAVGGGERCESSC